MLNPSTRAQFMEFLQSKLVAVLSTVSEDTKPMSATIYFCVDEDFNFYFMTKNFTRKHENLIHNSNVSLVIGTENEPATAQIQGTAEKITDQEECKKRLDQLQKRFFNNAYVAPLFQLSKDKNQIGIYKITPTWIRFLDLRKEKDRIDSDFVQIL